MCITQRKHYRYSAIISQCRVVGFLTIPYCRRLGVLTESMQNHVRRVSGSVQDGISRGSYFKLAGNEADAIDDAFLGLELGVIEPKQKVAGTSAEDEHAF